MLPEALPQESDAGAQTKTFATGRVTVSLHVGGGGSLIISWALVSSVSLKEQVRLDLPVNTSILKLGGGSNCQIQQHQ